MKNVAISDAKRLCTSLEGRVVLVIAVDRRGAFSAASYGETVKECKAAAKVLDALFDELESPRMFDVVDALRATLPGART